MDRPFLGLLLLMVATVKVSDGIFCPYYCSCHMNSGLRYVTCTNHSLINFDLRIHGSVQWLELNHNHLSVVNNYEFQNLGLTQLVRLNLSSNAIRVLDLHALSGLRFLQILDLSFNHLNSILTWTFDENPFLTHLYLQGNPFRFLSEREPLIASSSLQVLDLSKCNLGHIPAFTFSMLPQLTHLNLSNNQLVTLDDQAIFHLSLLKSLDISRNPMICDSHIAYITDVLRMKENSVDVIGSPCKDKENTIPSVEHNNEKSGKMIIFPQDADDEYYDSIEPEDSNFDSVEELPKCDPVNNTPEIVTQKSVNYHIPLPLPFLLVLTFSLGFLVALILVAFCVAFTKHRRIRRRRCQSLRGFSSLEPRDEVHSDLAPPTYSSLFSDDWTLPPTAPSITNSYHGL